MSNSTSENDAVADRILEVYRQLGLESEEERERFLPVTRLGTDREEETYSYTFRLSNSSQPLPSGI